ncbi:MAG: aldehyde dehydrogenase family protein [Candidatus Omnitrophica bacterium]|nr:aldehyde dehydrogenase family protein [Candidatus Omnitrophota bacterium]MDD5652545.1 aldehyde dehydrogenase family protein [Candidatus Omnitrophota bacterium]
MITYPLFINGELIETKEQNAILNPSTAEPFAQVSVAGEKEIENALGAARAAFDSGAWPKIPFSERKAFLLKIADGILEKAGELAQLETLNTGKPIKESTFMDIPSAAKAFQYIAENFEKFLVEDSPALEAQASAKLIREPFGVAALIVPWNYPLLIACWKLASSLAAGNCVVLKPSSLTPLSALELGKIIHTAGLPKGTVNIINGSGSKIGKALCSDKRVDIISFTGSNEVGKQIIEYASQNVKKLVMELGGKSANIICKDAPLDVAVNSSLCSIFLNQGQMCTGMSRILVESAIYDDFVSNFVEKTKRIKIGPGSEFETQIGPLVSRAQQRKVLGFVEDAKKQGGKVLCGGKIPQEANFKNGFFFEPTVIADLAPAAGILKEEIFGPVACISKFSSIEEAVTMANDSDFALAACIWAKDEAKAHTIAAKINAGTIWVNTYGMFYNELPYGGFKQSGFGKELGKEGFLEYARIKSVIMDHSPEGKPLVSYWYGF